VEPIISGVCFAERDLLVLRKETYKIRVMRCSGIQCAAVYCSVVGSVAVCVSQCVAVCCSVVGSDAMCCSMSLFVAGYRSVLQCVAVCCGVLQCVAV